MKELINEYLSFILEVVIMILFINIIFSVTEMFLLI